MTVLEFQLQPEWQNLTLKQILRKKLGFSAQCVKSLRDGGTAALDGHVSPLSASPNRYERLTVILPEDPPSPVKPVKGDLRLLFEDAHLLVLDKPAGLTVHPGPGHYEDTVGNLIAWHYEQTGQHYLFRPVNRLDRSTSGLMCVAKHAYAADRMRSLFLSDNFHKTYLAVCEGIPMPLQGTIDAPIARKNGSVLMREVHPDGKPACTHYETLSGFRGRSLIRLIPETGRTHQIRVHMAFLGHPLTGDFLYGTEIPDIIPRAALHAATLDFPHPISGKPLHFEAQLPEDMQRLIRPE